ncbi:mechanosensitive ion channel family protein [Flavihumibacter petaseus]|uniref:Putative MscS family protein n=1 Tax=Flavihumibacter petaseus NBRC 106054 TaxID=1220578 RepID=A0A0E9N0W3_9BACT|nr:mechanosensitive ion channel family protein [Flavihumibacter petaseus]GAO43398.1 putative MscS family protein [Flavihumibacter petaseus NBRC 106054]
MKWEWNTISQQLSGWIIDKGPGILAAIVLLFVGLWLIRLFGKWINKLLDAKAISPTLRYFLQNFVVISLQVLLILGVFQVAGIQLSFMAAIIAGFSVAAGLALSGTLQNFVGGILILLLRPFKVGDNIITQSQEGTVQQIQLFFTTVLTFDNKTIIIPNGQLSNNVVINLSREGKRRMDITLKFGYTKPLADVQNVIETALDKLDAVLKDPPRRIGVAALEPDKYAVTIEIWINAHGFRDAQYVIQRQIMEDLVVSGHLGAN